VTTIKKPNNNSKFPINNSCSRQKKKHITINSGPIGIDFVRFSRRFRDYSIQTSKASKRQSTEKILRIFLLRRPHREGIPKAVHAAGPSAQSSRKKVSGAGVIGRAPPSLIPPTFLPHFCYTYHSVPFLCTPARAASLFFRDKPQMQELMQHNTMMLMISAKI
jgi:hypothetical protein